MRKALIVAIGLALGATACGGGGDDDGDDTADTEAAADDGAGDEGGDESDAPAEADGPVMPDVICVNYAAALNTVQDAGIFNAKGEDATGEGRAQTVHKNWVVVETSPGPGEPVGSATPILKAVKVDEPSDC